MLIALAIFFGCASDSDDDSSSSTASSDTSVTYKGPGSIWTLDVSGDSFTLTEEEDTSVLVTAEGSYTKTTTGFASLTVSSSSGTNALDAGDKAIGVDIPGIAFLLKPMSDNSPVITFVKYGECPSENVEANWVKTKSNSRDASLGNGDADSSYGSPDAWAGQFNFDVSSSVATIPVSWSITNTSGDEFPVFFDTSETLGTGLCDKGILEISEASGTTRLFMTENGGAIVDITGTQSVIGFNKQTISTAEEIDGDYIGFVFFGAQGKVYPLSATSTNGTMVVDALSDDTESISQSAVGTVNNYQINTPANGFVKVTLDDSVSRPMVCNFNSSIGSSNKKILFCVTQDTDQGSTSYKHFNVLLVSK